MTGARVGRRLRRLVGAAVLAAVCGGLGGAPAAAAGTDTGTGTGPGTGSAAPSVQPTSATRSYRPPGPNDRQWWFAAWRIGDVWKTGAMGQGVTVAVMDAVITPGWPGLEGVLAPGSETEVTGKVDYDPTEHATAMAVLIAGQGGPSGLLGVAPRAKILSVGWHSERFAERVMWAVNHGAKILSISIADHGACPAGYVDVVRWAVDHGAILVASAGNDPSSPPVNPSTCPGVLSVGAVDNQRRAWVKTRPDPAVDVAAPGVAIPRLNALRLPATTDGTSQATALTAGALALVWSGHPSLTNRQVLARVLATVRDDATRPGPDRWCGTGVVRPYQAVTEDVPLDAPNPVFDELDRIKAPGSVTNIYVPGNTGFYASPSAPPSTWAAYKDPSPAAAKTSRAGPAAPLWGVLIGAGALLAAVAVAVVLRRPGRRGRAPTDPSP